MPTQDQAFTGDHPAIEAFLAQAGLPSTALRHGYYAERALHHIGHGLETGALRLPEDDPLVDDSGGPPYQPVALLRWSAAEVAPGKLLQVKELPKDSKLKLFRVLVSTHRTNYLVPTG